MTEERRDDERDSKASERLEASGLTTREKMARRVRWLMADPNATKHGKAWLAKQPPSPLGGFLSREPILPTEPSDATERDGLAEIREPNWEELRANSTGSPNLTGDQRRNLIEAQMELVGHVPPDEPSGEEESMPSGTGDSVSRDLDKPTLVISSDREALREAIGVMVDKFLATWKPSARPSQND